MRIWLVHKRPLRVILFLFFFLILGFISVRSLILNRGNVVGIDWDVPFNSSQMLNYGQSQIYLWHHFQSLTGFPSSDVDAMKLNWTSIYLILGSLGLSGEILSKGLLLLYFPLAAFNAYLLLRELGIRGWPRLLSVLIFVFSPAVFGWMVLGTFVIFLYTYALLPLALFLYLRSRKTKSRFLYMLGIVFCFLPFPVYISMFTIGFIIVEITFRYSTTNSSWRGYIRELSWVAMLVGLFILLQSYWILPLFTRTELSGGFRYADYTRIDTFNAFRQLGSYIWEWTTLIERSELLILLGYVPIIIALGSMIMKPRRNPGTVFILLTIMVIGFIFLLNKTDWVERQFLYLTVFRDTSKLYALLNVCTLVLIGYFFRELHNFQSNRYLKLLILVPVILYISIYLKPYWNGEISTESTLATLSSPTDSENVVHWSRSQDNIEGKTLWLPTGTYRINQIISKDQIEPYYTDVYAYLSDIDGGIQSVNYRHSLIADFWLVNQFYDLVSNKDLGSLLGLFAIDRIFFRQDHEIQNWMSPYSARQWGYSSNRLRENLRNTESLVAQEQFGNLTVYHNNDALPLIYPTQNLHALSGDLKHLTDLLRSEEYRYGKESFAIVGQNPNLSNLASIDSVILGDGNIMDLVLQFIPPSSASIVEPGAYIRRGEVEDGNWASVHNHYWADPYQRTIGEAAIAHTPASLEIPIQIPRTDKYVFLGKVYFGPDASQITLNLTPQNKAKAKTATIITQSDTADSFKWVEISRFWSELGQDPYQLDQGSYELEIQNHPGWNVISELAIIPRTDLDRALSQAKDFIQATGTNHIFSFNGNEYTKDIFLPEDETYSIRVHRVPNPTKSPVYFEGKKEINWKKEINNWQVFPSLDPSSQISTEFLNPPIFVYQEGFYPPEKYFGFDRRWGSNGMRVLAINPNRKTLRGNLQFSALTSSRVFEFLFLHWPQSINREFEIWLNDQKIGSFEIPSSKDLFADPTRIEIPDLILRPGANDIVFVALQGTSPLELMREYTGDKRQVSIQILDDMQFSIRDQEVASAEFSSMPPPLLFAEDDELQVSLYLHPGEQENGFALISRDIDLDIEEYPNFRITYQVDSPSIQAVDVAAGIDSTGDQMIDYYVYATSIENLNSSELSEIKIDLLDDVKSRYPIDYANKKEFRLKKVFIILHKRWETDVINQATTELFDFNIRDLQFYSEFSLLIPKSINRLGLINENEVNSLISEVKNVTPQIRTNDQNELIVTLDFQSPRIRVKDEGEPIAKIVKFVLKDGSELTGEIESRNNGEVKLRNVKELGGAEILIQMDSVRFTIGEEEQKIQFEQEYIDLTIPLSKPVAPGNTSFLALDYMIDESAVQAVEMKLGVDSNNDGETDTYILPFKRQVLENWEFLGSFGNVDLYQTVLPSTFPDDYSTEIGSKGKFTVEKDGKPLPTTWKRWRQNLAMVSVEEGRLIINLPRGKVPTSTYSIHYAPAPIPSKLYPRYQTFQSNLQDALDDEGYTVTEVIVRLKRIEEVDISKFDGQGLHNFYLKDLRFYDKCPYSSTTPRCFKYESGEPLLQVLGKSYNSNDPATMLLADDGYWAEIATEVFLPAGSHINGINTFPDDMYTTDIVELVRTGEQSSGHSKTETSFYKVNPTRYVAKVNTDTPFHLVFSETYHNNWKAYILEDGSTSNDTWYEWSALMTWLTERGRRTEITDHYLVNAYANGWYVPKTGNYTIVLEYTPQRLFEIGAIISGITLLICAGYVAVDLKGRLWK